MFFVRKKKKNLSCESNYSFMYSSLLADQWSNHCKSKINKVSLIFITQENNLKITPKNTARMQHQYCQRKYN